MEKFKGKNQRDKRSVWPQTGRKIRKKKILYCTVCVLSSKAVLRVNPAILEICSWNKTVFNRKLLKTRL